MIRYLEAVLRFVTAAAFSVLLGAYCDNWFAGATLFMTAAFVDSKSAERRVAKELRKTRAYDRYVRSRLVRVLGLRLADDDELPKINELITKIEAGLQNLQSSNTTVPKASRPPMNSGSGSFGIPMPSGDPELTIEP